MALALLGATQGGQGAVERVRAGLAFLAKHLGLDVRVGDLSPSFVVPVVNEDGQQLEKKPPNTEVAPLLPRDFVILAKLSRSVWGVVFFMACCVLIHALGGVRFRHLQRSIETDFDVRQCILFRCAKGKARSQGPSKGLSLGHPRLVLLPSLHRAGVPHQHQALSGEQTFRSASVRSPGRIPGYGRRLSR